MSSSSGKTDQGNCCAILGAFKLGRVLSRIFYKPYSLSSFPLGKHPLNPDIREQMVWSNKRHLTPSQYEEIKGILLRMIISLIKSTRSPHSLELSECIQLEKLIRRFKFYLFNTFFMYSIFTLFYKICVPFTNNN